MLIPALGAAKDVAVLEWKKKITISISIHDNQVERKFIKFDWGKTVGTNMWEYIFYCSSQRRTLRK